MTDAIVLAVVVPIFGAMLSMIAGLRFDRSGWTVAALTCLAQLGTALAILYTVVQDGTQRYELAGFTPPEGIELVADGLSAPVIVLVATVSLAVVVYARQAGPRGNAFYTLYLLLVGGLAGVTLTGDIFNMYVFLEITGLAAYALVASGDSTESAVAGLKYLILGTIGASLFLLGAGYAYIATGTLNMVDLSEQLAAAGYGSRLVLGAFGLLVTGLLVKVALFPVHTWQPGAYSNAPDSVSVYISALVSTVAAYAVARVLYTVFTPEFFTANPIAQTALVYAAAVSIIAGSVLAVLQRDLKRMLAYSSVSQFGMVVAGFALLSQSAAVGGVIHLIGHAVLKGGLFAAVGVVAAQTGARSIDEYAGLASRAPLSAGLVAVLGLSLVGVPPSVGFVGKFYIAVGAVETGTWPIAAVIFASTVLTLAYFARIIERMYFAQPAVEPSSDGAVAVDVGDGVSADGGEEIHSSAGASPEMVAVVVVAAVAAVTLGFAGSAIESFLEPTLVEVFG
ncbi:monovalent cation/H+ antiporter subunit D family protein [Halobacteriaceae bacterium SHR40]|uniref:monovalent cation/H+ antiporter subunit D family protein n=1 Tax=Halovenus amylolytica TaxID=2500550 RepID=UPI000FE34C88